MPHLGTAPPALRDSLGRPLPHLTATSALAVTTARGQEKRRGELAPETADIQDWHLPTGLY